MKNKKFKLSRFYKVKKNNVSIDIKFDQYRDVYSEWDFSPFTNRDLDDDFVEYLYETSLEGFCCNKSSILNKCKLIPLKGRYLCNRKNCIY
jgi:hypothetical protein